MSVLEIRLGKHRKTLFGWRATAAFLAPAWLLMVALLTAYFVMR